MKQLKIMGLSLLALSAFMAMSASAAQAKWLLLEKPTGGVAKSVLTYNLTGTVEAGRLLVIENGLKIKCAGGEASGEAKLNETHATLSGKATIKFKECVVDEFETTCVPMSTGQANGVIVAEGSGEGGMEGTKVFVTASSTKEAPFTNVEILNGPEGECPLIEVNGEVFGSLRIEVVSPLTEAVEHTAELVKQELKYGKNTATLENLSGGTLKGKVKLANGAQSSVHLVKLPGCEPGPC